MALKKYATGYLFVSPLLIVLFGLIIYPFFYSIFISLTDYTLGLPTKFVGLGNYLSIIPEFAFKRTLYNTFIFSTVTTLFRLLIGLSMALLLNRELKFRGFFRGFFLLPWVLPAIVIALIWFWILNDMFGIVNLLLEKIGFRPVAWLGDGRLALMSVIFVNIWRGFPFFGICLLAGLQTIPVELYEAAKVDGASSWQQFISVTVPMLMPVIMVTALLSLIWTFNEFQMVFLLTRGGPANLTQLLGIYSYYKGIVGLQLGKGTAISLFGFPLLVSIIVIMSYLLKKREY